MKPVITLVLISLLFFLPQLKLGLPQNQDSSGHVIRIAQLDRTLTEGQLPAVWLSGVNYGFGAPILDFYYPLPYYLGVIFHHLGLDFESSFKAVLLLSWVLAPLAVYSWLRGWFPRGAFVGAAFFALASYRFLDLYVRGDFGELLALVFLGLLFFSFDQIDRSRNKPVWATIIGICYGLLVLSHNFVALVSTPLTLAYIIVSIKSTKARFLALAGLGQGLIFSAFFWFPALWESRYLNNTLFADFYKNHFISPGKIISSPWGFGPDINHSGGLSVALGPLSFFILVMAVSIFFQFWRKEKNIVRRTTLLFIAVIAVSLFLMTPYSQFLWMRLPLMSKFQFPWRFMSLVLLPAGFLTAYGFSRLNSGLFTLLVLALLIAVSSGKTITPPFSHQRDVSYVNSPNATYYHAEATTRWLAGDADHYPSQKFLITAGQGTIQSWQENSWQQNLTVQAASAVDVLDNTNYFPGWTVLSDGQVLPIEYQNQNFPGLITFSLPPGRHQVIVQFGPTKVRTVSLLISLAGALSAVSLLLVSALLSWSKPCKN